MKKSESGTLDYSPEILADANKMFASSKYKEALPKKIASSEELKK